MEQYFGTYTTFETVSEKEAARLLSADNLIGDVYDIELELRGEHRGWLVNRFGDRVAYLGNDISRKLSICQASGLTSKAVLSYVAYSELDEDDPKRAHNCRYWGEVAVVCYPERYAEAFERFIASVGKKMHDNVRLRVDFEREAVLRIIDSDGAWVPEQTVPMPPKRKGTVIMKDTRSLSDKMIEQGRAGNKGCYVLSWGFLIALAVGAAWIVKMVAGL